MEHFDITGIALIAVAATLCGMVMVRFRQPSAVGYILTGVLLGPAGLGLVTERAAIATLAEMGVILLLFFLGMELSLRAFKSIWRLALITTVGQIALAWGAMTVLAQYVGWPVHHAMLFGFCLALSSTAIAVKTLENLGELRTRSGQLVVGILIAQDLLVAPMVILVTEADPTSLTAWGKIVLAMVLLLGIIVIMSRRERSSLPFFGALEERPDLAPLATLAWCFALASITGVMGLSPAFGAFMAGLILGNSHHRTLAHAQAGPIQAVLLMVFFLSVGMLIDFAFLLNNLGLMASLWLMVTLFKIVLNAVLLRLQGLEWRQSLSASLVLGQLGEFSFILAASALSAGMISVDVHKTIVAVTVLSLCTSPLFIDTVRRLQHRAVARVRGVLPILQLVYFRELRISRFLTRVCWRSVQSALGEIWTRRSGSQNKKRGDSAS